MYVCSYNAPMQYQQIYQVLACQGLTIPLHVLAIAILCTLSSRPYPYSCPSLSCILQSTVVLASFPGSPGTRISTRAQLQFRVPERGSLGTRLLWFNMAK